VKGDQPALGTIIVDGRPVAFMASDSVGSCLMRAGILTIRLSLRGQARGVFCGIGICNECLVTIDDRRNVRACQAEPRPGLVVHTGTT
jgi:predicted molibdopterin-dependent oxidoreductase YjgC